MARPFGHNISPTDEVFYPRLQNFTDFSVPIEASFDLSGQLTHLNVPPEMPVYKFVFR